MRWWAAGALFALIVCVGGAGRVAAAPPNILFIYADDQSLSTLSCYPQALPGIATPQIDALARSGIRFDGAYLGSWCMPSRATMLTGRHPHGIQSMSMEGQYPGSTYDPRQCPFFPAELRRGGYQTAQIGKWHTGTDAGYGRDWDYQVVWNRPKHPDNAGAYYTRQLLAFNGEERWQEGYPADNYTEWACDYIRGRHRDPRKPWYLWVCYGNVHGPNTPAARHQGKYASLETPLPADIFPPRPDKPAYLNKTQAWVLGADGRVYAGKSAGEQVGDDQTAPDKRGRKPGVLYDDWVRRVHECALALDEGVGQLLAALRDSGQLENTLVVYTADQGFAMGEHGLRSKLAPYDASYRSPLIVSFAGRYPAGQECSAAVNGADLAATFLALAEVDVPWKLHGRDLTPLLENPRAEWSHPCLYEHMDRRYGDDVLAFFDPAAQPSGNKEYPPYVAVVQDGYKLVRYLAAEHGEELYDLRKDPDELINLVRDAGQAERLAGLRVALRAELERTEAPFVERLFPAAGAAPAGSE